MECTEREAKSPALCLLSGWLFSVPLDLREHHLCCEFFISTQGHLCLKSCMGSSQEAEAVQVSAAIELILISACSGLFTLWEMWVCRCGAVWDYLGAAGSIRNTSLDSKSKADFWVLCACSSPASSSRALHQPSGQTFSGY